MDLRQLRYFTAIADYGSFSEAAARLRVAQSALSRHMQRHGGSCVFTTIDTEGKGLFPDEATKAPDYVTGS